MVMIAIVGGALTKSVTLKRRLVVFKKSPNPQGDCQADLLLDKKDHQ